MEFDQLIGHLSPDCRDTFEQAVASASSRSHFTLEIEHWLQQSLAHEDRQIVAAVRHLGLSPDRLNAALLQRLDILSTGNPGFPRIGEDVARLLFEAWMLASSQFHCLEIRSAHLILALLENDLLRTRAIRISDIFNRIEPRTLRNRLAPLLTDDLCTREQNAGNAAPGRTPALDRFTVDLTAQAQAGRLDPVIAREPEIRQTVDILCRRRQNNPVLTGEAGVGKTAVVEGLAQRITEGDVPHSLRGVRLHTLDLGLLQSGAGVKGEFENRLKSVIGEVQRAPHPVILFIDEAHMLIGTGGQAGGGDAANLLKPALARGELRTIAATTWSEYKRSIETDAALTRRFQVVPVEEPSEEDAIAMLRGFADRLEAHHQVAILDEGIRAAVTLSKRYLTGRQLPDKCVSLLDTACARVSLTRSTTPAGLEDQRRRLADARRELDRLQAETLTGEDHGDAIDTLERSTNELANRCEETERRRRAVRATMDEIDECRRQLRTAADTHGVGTDGTADNGHRKRLRALRRQLVDKQGDAPLVLEQVDAQVVAQVISNWTGIPVGRMRTGEIAGVLGLEGALRRRVVGQDHALELIARSMRTARLKLGDPKRPLGVFLLVGPSGVGKTETALALAEQLYGSDEAVTVINMSEFKEEHKVSLLMGSPPGYVGYGEGGVLTEAVRRRPYSVVLLDEMEKAHPGVQDIFYQVFDKGMLRDGEGRDIDFRNTVIIITSNTAGGRIEKLTADSRTHPTAGSLVEAIGPALRGTFKPAFLGRVSVVPYYPLGTRELDRIVEMQLRAIRERLNTHYGADLVCAEGLLARIAAQCRESDAGARQVSAVLNNGLLPAISERMLRHLAADETMSEVAVGLTTNGEFDVTVTGGGPAARGAVEPTAATADPG